jgi:hypothetical protein
MGQTVPTQHPAVVLRSRFNNLRALLAIALIAVVSLSAAVVILARDSDTAATTSGTRTIEPINHRGPSPVPRYQPPGVNGPGMRP